MSDMRFRALACAAAGAALAWLALAAPLAGQQRRPAARGVRTGIQVHGKWTIVVRNPDGTIAAQRVIENSLQSVGQRLLVGLLDGYVVPGEWIISLSGPSANAAQPCLAGSSGSPCFIAQANGSANGAIGCSGFSPGGCTADLTVSVQTVPSTALVLTGEAAIPPGGGGAIGGVGTELSICNQSASALLPAPGATVSPAACAGGGNSSDQVLGPGNSPFFGFTGTALASPISVVPNQTVEVTVVISFS